MDQNQNQRIHDILRRISWKEGEIDLARSLIKRYKKELKERNFDYQEFRRIRDEYYNKSGVLL